MKERVSVLTLMAIALLSAGCGGNEAPAAGPDSAGTAVVTGPSTTSSPAPVTPIPAPEDPSTTADAPLPADDLQPSATPDAIDSFPVLDPSDFPASDREIVIVGGWQQSVGDYGWLGIVGAPSTAPDGAPTSLTQVQAMPASSTYSSQSIPGRREGVRESTQDGISSLSWEVDEVRFVTMGPDIELLYDLIDRIRAIEPTADRSGYEFVGGLPTGIVELDPPRPQRAGWFPGINDAAESARLSLYVDGQSPLQAMVQGGGDVRPVTINGHPGYLSTRNGSVVSLAFAVATDETVRISYSPYPEEDLIAIAERIEFTDEATWREHYGVTWGNGQGDPPTGTNP